MDFLPKDMPQHRKLTDPESRACVTMMVTHDAKPLARLMGDQSQPEVWGVTIMVIPSTGGEKRVIWSQVVTTSARKRDGAMTLAVIHGGAKGGRVTRPPLVRGGTVTGLPPTKRAPRADVDAICGHIAVAVDMVKHVGLSTGVTGCA